MIDIIHKAIGWEKLDENKKSDLAINVGKALLSKDTGILTFSMQLNFVMDYSEVKTLKKEILEICEDLNGINFDIKYSNMVQPKKLYLNRFVENYLKDRGEYAEGIANTVLFDKTNVDGNSLVIQVAGEFAAERLSKEVKKDLAAAIKNAFDFEVDIDFRCDKEECNKIISLSEERTKKELEQRAEIQKEIKKPQKSLATDRPLGKAIKGDITEISELEQDTKGAIIEGILFNMEERLLKNKKTLVSLYITDKKTSICAKCFLNDEKTKILKESIAIGDGIRLRGDVQWDDIERAVIVMARDIEKKERVYRQDNAEVKRVELHAHTKMSAMDGLTPVAELIETHKRWGHSAVAITDHGVVQGFPEAQKALKGADMKILYGMEGYVFDDADCRNEDGSIDYKKKYTNHIILIAATQEGLKNLYKLVSFSHVKYFYRKPRLPKSVIKEHRDGLIIGAACEAGEVYRSILNKKPEEEIKEIIDFYDYLEIQPVTNNRFLIEKGLVKDENEIREINKKVISLGKKYGKITCATTDAHYAEPEAAIFRNIVQATMGYSDEGSGNGLYLRTTEEMLEEFSYLGDELAYEVVVTNTNKIADMVDRILPVPKEKYPPKIPNADVKLRETCNAKAKELYGEVLPNEIKERLSAEIEPIIREGYAVMYIAAKMLVDHSMEAGYLVGSRGSVGSSFVATMAGITEVNPLPPHYLCPECKYIEWGDENEYDCGVDMPDKKCPKCGHELKKEGFTIPFQTFLGFEADKEPDIDLNFAGEYQAEAHKYVDEIFGAKNVYKAGTMSTVAKKSAYGMVKKYYDEKGLPVNKFEIERLTSSCEGIKKTTGQHPGGIIIVPDDHEIYEFCPIQRPANDMKSDVITTHFDYHSIDKNLLKLDILGHDVPSIIRHLQDMTGVNPVNDVPLSDPKVNSIFTGTEALNIKIKDYKFKHGSYGIPEFGTKFTRQMLDDTQPKRFADLVRISGFSHGTDVWLNNAQEWIKSGTATMKEVISTRDDIMNYLILKGLPKKDAFAIMERVRKGGGLSEEQEELMIANKIPSWYITSCKKIKYMFPRAHAVAYVMMSYRIAYFKVYYPLEFYAAYFTTKTSSFDADIAMLGIDAVYKKIREINIKESNYTATPKEVEQLTVLEMIYEFYARGFEFCHARLGESEAKRFRLKEGKIQLPFVVLEGLGENAAAALYDEYLKAPYETIEEIKQRAKINKVGIETLKVHGVLGDLPETDQLSIFELF